jgi:hypothetical protein
MFNLNRKMIEVKRKWSYAMAHSAHVFLAARAAAESEEAYDVPQWALTANVHFPGTSSSRSSRHSFLTTATV